LAHTTALASVVLKVIVVLSVATAIVASKIARIVGSRANFIVTAFIVCLGGSEIELDRGPIRKAPQVCFRQKWTLAQRAITSVSKIQKDAPKPKGQKILNLNRSSKEMRYHHVHSAIDSSFVSGVRPDLGSRIYPNGYGTGP